MEAIATVGEVETGELVWACCHCLAEGGNCHHELERDHVPLIQVPADQVSSHTDRRDPYDEY